MINDPTQPLMTIADLSTVWVTALVPEKDLNALSKEVFEALEEHGDALARETKSVGLVILRGAGGNFSSDYRRGWRR
jgi:enoyl-CoA hydratase/carnithine racemase